MNQSNDPTKLYEVGDFSINRFEICISELIICHKRSTSCTHPCCYLLILVMCRYLKVYLKSDTETWLWKEPETLNPKPYRPTELSKVISLPSCCRPVMFWRWWQTGLKYKGRTHHGERVPHKTEWPFFWCGHGFPLVHHMEISYWDHGETLMSK